MVDWNQIDSIIMGSQRILLVTHENPDGDGLGSIAAMYHHLKECNKNCRAIHASSLPYEYEFLNTDGLFESFDPDIHLPWLRKADLAILFDIGNFDRISILKDDIIKNGLQIINIDHHPHLDDDTFTQNIVDTNAAATGELIYEYLIHVRKSGLTKKICEGLYTAIMTDTGSFSYSNTNVRCHEIAIESIKRGVDPTDIYQKVYESGSRSRMKLLGTIINNMNFDYDGKLAWFTIDGEMLSKTGSNSEDVDGFTDFVRKIRGVEIALMIFETENGTCRVNFRSKGRYLVNGIAKSINGGGHVFAAGARVQGSLKEVTSLVLNRTIQSMKIQDKQTQ
jgi:phosphoesterase RecJ-like protein